MMRFMGKKALVTGAAGGIGKSLVEKLRAEGASVAVTDINVSNIEAEAYFPGDPTAAQFCDDLPSKTRDALGSNPRHPAYCASKGGLHALTRAVAVDHGPEGIRCNAVAPGWINTELNEDFIKSLSDPKVFKNKIGAIHPLERSGEPLEVSELIVWLASEKASFMTGQVLTIDGGRTAKLSLP